MTIITGQTFCISQSPDALTSCCTEGPGPPILQTHLVHISPLLTLLFLLKMVLKCDFLHGAFLGSAGGFSPPAASKHCLWPGPWQAGGPWWSRGSQEWPHPGGAQSVLAEGQCPGSRRCLLPLVPRGSWRMDLRPGPSLSAGSWPGWTLKGGGRLADPVSSLCSCREQGSRPSMALPTSLNQWLFLGSGARPLQHTDMPPGPYHLS